MGERGIEQIRDLKRGGDMHGGREAIVRRLAQIDMIVGMNRRFRAARRAQHLVRAVGDHLVDIHVGLGAGAGLPDHEREMLVELAVDHLLRGGDDRLGAARIERAELEIGFGRGAFDDAEGVDQRQRHAFGADAQNFGASARFALPNSDRQALQSARSCRSRSGSWPCRYLVVTPAFDAGIQAPANAPPIYFLRKRSSRTTSAPPGLAGSVWTSFGPVAAVAGGEAADFCGG